MGLDNSILQWLTLYMQPLATGLGSVLRALGLGKKARVSPFEKERRTFELEVRRELLKLKEKGLSIPVFTL